ncbi:hypothetical protein K474DRAFT_1655185 [Panus rudis PR-1116 ss-1]|nr:hypothetical protein K474DRAFT_1655185 [Panus rudis PR-1116 ss-1]
MLAFTTAAFFALVSSAFALSVTAPENGTNWGSQEPQIVAWTKVNTDPSTFAITLVHQASQPNTRQLLKENVDANSGQITLDAPSGGWPTGTAYQINLVQDGQHLDSILAQSQQFNIVEGSGDASSAASSASSSGSSSASRSATASSSSRTTATVSGSSPTGSSGTSTDSTADINPSTTGTANNNGAISTGIQTGLFGLVAFAGALLA